MTDWREFIDARIAAGATYEAITSDLTGMVDAVDRPAAAAYLAKRHPHPEAASPLTPSRRGGPAPGRGLTRERIVAATRERIESDDDDPTQEAIAEDLGYSPRWVSRVGGDWAAIVREARD